MEPASCGKVRYPTKRDALTARNARLRSHGHNRPDDLRVYHCPDCDGHHLTSNVTPPRTRLQRLVRMFTGRDGQRTPSINNHQHAPL
jgi:hypothetical protein